MDHNLTKMRFSVRILNYPVKLRGVKLMFYDVDQAINACEDDPSLIFELIREGHIELVDKILSKKLVSINTKDENGNDVLTRLLKHGNYDVVLKHMGNKEWDINHQNNDGDTFAHILVTINYVDVLEILKKLKKNKNFMPNIKNNNGETILDRSLNNNYIYTTMKILEDSRFNNIDIVSFKHLYDTYIKSKNYGKYSKIMNLEIILDSLEEKKLLPNMERLVKYLHDNFESFKEAIFNNKSSYLDNIIKTLLLESNA